MSEYWERLAAAITDVNKRWGHTGYMADAIVISPATWDHFMARMLPPVKSSPPPRRDGMVGRMHGLPVFLDESLSFDEFRVETRALDRKAANG